MVSLQWLTPPKAAKLLAVSPDKITFWIDSGELKAVNVATNPKGKRPRWRISPEALEEFTRRRAAVPEPTPKTRRRPFQRKDGVTKAYY